MKSVRLLLDAGADPWAFECQANVDAGLFGGSLLRQKKHALFAAAKTTQPPTEKVALHVARQSSVRQ